MARGRVNSFGFGDDFNAELADHIKLEDDFNPMLSSLCDLASDELEKIKEEKLKRDNSCAKSFVAKFFESLIGDSLQSYAARPDNPLDIKIETKKMFSELMVIFDAGFSDEDLALILFRRHPKSLNDAPINDKEWFESAGFKIGDVEIDGYSSVRAVIHNLNYVFKDGIPAELRHLRISEITNFLLQEKDGALEKGGDDLKLYLSSAHSFSPRHSAASPLGVLAEHDFGL